MNTGEDAQGLRKIIDFTRLISIAMIVYAFYIFCFFRICRLGLDIRDY
ncbi:hypothetical protein CS542_07930 [Pedobacter sp. IW39]|nr:hypothetical protein CS542_07930 [Pedobacter sp. IW39]